MINAQCKTCKYLSENPEGLDWGMSNEALSVIVDCSRDSIRRHRLHTEDPGLVTGAKPEDRSGGEWIPRRRWDKADGSEGMSWQWAPDNDSVGYDLDFDKLDSAFQFTVAEFATDVSEDEAVLALADPQIGKAGEAGGGTRETIQRVLASVDRAIETYRTSKPKHLYLVDMGDPIENIFSTSSQVGTNDLSLPDQILTYSRLMMLVIERLAPWVGGLTYVAVTSNHGEARNAQKANPYGSENDWGLVLQQIVKDRVELSGIPVDFVRPEINEDTAVVTAECGIKLAFNHGHHSGSQQKLKQWTKDQIVGRRPGWDAELWFFGHYHNDGYFRFGYGQIGFHTPAIDPGSAWFTRKSGESCPPGMLGLRIGETGWHSLTVF